MTASQALASRTPQQLIDAALSAADDDQRWEVVVALHGMGNDEVFALASGMLASPEVADQELGIDVLGQLGYKQHHDTRVWPYYGPTLPALRPYLAPSAHVALTSAAVRAFRHLGVEDVLDEVAALSNHEDEFVRGAVAVALGGRTEPQSIVALLHLMADQSEYARDWATFGIVLSEVDGDDIRDALFARVDDASIDVRCEAMMGLARRHDPRCIAPIRACLAGDTLYKLCLEAAIEAADPSFREPLERWLDDESDDEFSPLLERAIAEIDRRSSASGRA